MRSQKNFTFVIFFLIQETNTQSTTTLNSTLPVLNGGSANYSFWSNSLSLLRNVTLDALGTSYSDSMANKVYTRPEYFLWLNNASFLLHIMSYDLRLASPTLKNNFQNWTAQRLIDDTLLRIPLRPNVIVLWGAAAFSPLLGIDGRNFLEILRSSLPGSIPPLSSSSSSSSLSTTLQDSIDRLDSLRQLVSSFHALTPPIPVLLAVVPWDTGTTPETIDALSIALPYIITNTSLDGIFFADSGQVPYNSSFDNSTGIERYYVVAADGLMPNTPPPSSSSSSSSSSSLDSQHPLVFQQMSRRIGPASNSTGGLIDPNLQLSLSAYRYFERRHVASVSRDWAKGGERMGAIFSAFVDGSSISIFENVFGFTNKVSPREGQLIARAASILSFVSSIVRAGNPPLCHPSSNYEKIITDQDHHHHHHSSIKESLPKDLRSLDWLPLLPTNITDGSIAVSQFTSACPLYINTFDPITSPGLVNNCSIFLIANTANFVNIVELNVSVALDLASISGSKSTITNTSVAFFDLYEGTGPFYSTLETSLLVTSLEPYSIRAFLSIPLNNTQPVFELLDFLSRMKNMTTEPLSNFSSTWTPSLQTSTSSNSTAGFSSPPPGMILVNGMLSWYWSVMPVWPAPFDRNDALDAINNEGVDVQYPWETFPSGNHSAIFDIASFFIDQSLVTNEDYFNFLYATGYNATISGNDPANFLRHWILFPNGTFIYNLTNNDGPRPVVWLSVSDASSYCNWKGRRLPTEWELQYAGQQSTPESGIDYRLYPWGNETCDSIEPRPCAKIDSSQNPPSPDPINLYPPSPIGIYDLVGLVWHLTDTIYSDDFTSAIILRGGSFYNPIAAMPSMNPELGPLPTNVSLYIPQALKLTQHLRLPFLTEAGQRNGLTGFRCVADSAIGIKE